MAMSWGESATPYEDDSPENSDDVLNGSEEPTPVAVTQTETASPSLDQQTMDQQSASTGATIPIDHFPIQRRFNYVPVNTVNFALPEGYSTSREDIKFLGSGAYGNVIKTTVKCRDGAIREVAVKKFRDPFSDNAQVRSSWLFCAELNTNFTLSVTKFP
ncbi:hypothetical protein TELCIR_25964 [Teladorsagia circumcincta]|uniref:Protein kinase domain-containing protein n=1 Tax=Teladorsagia circumcincta TaxID=45464 RepID=A0A2G9T468_TELCI|nr:hypothetical protein TELCIR_25964 [Teladorsagia circumcincta]